MDITLYISRFLYRIRKPLFFGTILTTALVAYFTQFLPKRYTVQTSIYTGIASNSGLNETKRGYYELNNTFDNIINLTKAKGTLEKVSLQLFAINMVHGSLEHDNMYITADNYRKLLAIVPDDVMKLICQESEEKTINNLIAYKEETPGNFMYSLFNYVHPNYSYEALRKVSVMRIANSDLIEISFQSNDPGIAMHTVQLIQQELLKAYDNIQYKTANDIVSYYEKELKRIRKRLDMLEDNLTNYNIEKGVINYTEQTKAIAIAFTNYEDRLEETRRTFNASQKIIEELEQKMHTRSQLMRSNANFVSLLDSLSEVNSKILDLELSADNDNYDSQLSHYKRSMQSIQSKISAISDDMNAQKYSKEGVAIDNMVDIWLNEIVRNKKAESELRVLQERKEDFIEKYKNLSPVGAQINRQEREIRVTEESYLEILHGLSLAKMKQKDIQLTSSALNTITHPTFPLRSDGSKRMILVLGAFLASIIFIIGTYLIVELIDRTLRDKERTERLTGVKVLGAFTGKHHLKHRGFYRSCLRTCAQYLANTIIPRIKKGEPYIINLVSIEEKEGKSFVANLLFDFWEEKGFLVEYIEADKDFPIDNNYLTASHISEIYSDFHTRPDIIIVEHKALNQESISIELLKHSNLTLIIANSQRIWKNSDQLIIDRIKNSIPEDDLYIILNNASSESVEEIIGDLPPKSLFNYIKNHFFYLGLTGNSPQIK